MTYFSVVQIDMHPAPYVAATGSARSAQILARLVAERCPGNVFGVRDSADFKGPKSNGFIRDCARSFEVQTLTAQGRLQGIIVACMPALLGTAMTFIKPGLMIPFFKSVNGMASIGLTALLIAVGWFFIRKIITIDV